MVHSGSADRSTGDPCKVKHIRKTGTPRAYAEWCATVTGTQKADWREVRSTVKREVLTSMIADQGGLCAYTMRRIDEHSSHVEHVKPQSRCRADRPESDLDYGNLVACFPRGGQGVSCRYGAYRKGGWWEENGAQFVSPLHPFCENVFRFRLDGRIDPINNRIDAMTTINVLRLDDRSLAEDRKRAIDEFIYGPTSRNPMSPAAARRALGRICDRTHDGTFYEFCVALRTALSRYLDTLEKLQRRRRHARRNS